MKIGKDWANMQMRKCADLVIEIAGGGNN